MSTSICTQEGDSFEKNACNISCHTCWNYTTIKYVWNISNISMLFVKPRKILSPPICSESNREIWRIELEKTSVCIWCLDILLLAKPQGKGILTEIEIYILDNNNLSVNKKSSRHILIEAGQVLFENFISEKSLFEDSNTLLLNDTLRIVCKIKSESTINHKPIYVIKNDDFNENLSKDLEALFENQNKFSDVSIIAEEITIKVNKNILITRSQAFSSMFEHDDTLNAVEINDFPYKVVYEMIRFMYCSKVKGIETMASELLHAAEKYGIADLKKLCEITLDKNLCDSNIVQYLSLADLCNATYLKDKCIELLKIQSNGSFEKEKLKEISLLNSKLMLEVCLALNSG